MGTFRTMDESWRFKAHELIEQQARAITAGMGAEIDFRIDVGYPTVYNHEGLNSIARNLAETFLGKEKVEETELRMGAEDFGYYSQQIPGCFYRLGTGNIDKGIISGVHTPTFNIDETAIPIGMGIMAWLGAKAKMTGNL
jgi:hippurate hydrolase